MKIYNCLRSFNGSLCRSQSFKFCFNKKLQDLFLTRCFTSRSPNYFQIQKDTDASLPNNDIEENAHLQVYSINYVKENSDILKQEPNSQCFHIPSKGLIVYFKDRALNSTQLFAGEKDEKILIKNIHSFLAAYPNVNNDVEQKESTTNTDSQSTVLSINPHEWHQQKFDIKKLPSNYAKLAKIRLTGLVVITTIGGYMLAPLAIDPLVLLSCTLGTALTSSGANTFNQFLEIPYDSQMNRTKNRVLVKGILSPLHCATFGTICFGSGVALLYFGVNPLTASLGALNFFLYTCACTPLKRMSIANTWVGSIVGAIPPLMGWSACTGDVGIGGLIMAGILFCWQFPHFNSLSWNLRPDYSRAGYRMMSVTNPGLCRRTTLQYSAILSILPIISPICDVTSWMFPITSLPLNLYLCHLSWNFYRDTDSKSSRKLFRFSLIHLPALLMLMFISKKHKKEENTLDTKFEKTS